MNLIDELNQIHQLARQGEAKHAHTQLQELINRTDLSEKDILRIQCEELYIFDYLGQLERIFESAPKLIQRIKEIGETNLLVEALFHNANVLWLLGEPEKSLESVSEGEKLLTSISELPPAQIDIFKAWFLYIRSRVYSNYLNNPESALRVAREGLRLFNAHNEISGAAYIEDSLGELYSGINQRDQAKTAYLSSLRLFKQINDQWGIAHSHWKLGDLFLYEGEIDLAYQYLHKSKSISEKIDHQESLGHALGSLGRLYIQKGDLDQAYKCFERSLEIYTTHHREWFIALSLDKLGDIFFIKGELNQALRYFQRALTIFEFLDSTHKFISYFKIGKIHHAQGDYEIASKLYHKHLDHVEEIYIPVYPFSGHPYLTLYNLIKLNIDKQDFGKAREYIQKLKLLNTTDTNDWSHQVYSLGLAALLKFEGRTLSVGKAMALYQEVADANIIDFELTLDAHLNLVDLFIEEFTHYRNRKSITDAHQRLKTLTDIAEGKNLYSILAESYFLQSKLSLIELKIEESQNFLEKALNVAIEKNLKRLSEIIILEKKFLQNQESIKVRIKKLDSPELTLMNEMAETTHLKSLINRIIHSRFYLDKYSVLEIFKQHKIQIESCFSSFSERGWTIHLKTEKCPVDKRQIRSILDYSGVLYQYGELGSLYGPFPLPLATQIRQNEYHYISYGTRLRDEHISDTRLLAHGGTVPVIFLIIYPKQFDDLMLMVRDSIVDYFDLLSSELQTISQISQDHLYGLENRIIRAIISEIEQES